MHYARKLPLHPSSYDIHGAVCLVLNQDEKILLHLRDDIPSIVYPNHWAVTGGHVEIGECPEQAAIREVKEESGLDIDNLIWLYDIENPGNAALDQVFLAHVDAQDSDLILGEGQELGFFSYEETRGMLVVPAVQSALDHFFELDIPKMHIVKTPFIDFQGMQL